MAQNKGAIVRYRALDRCLRKRNLKYGIEELRHACEEALYDAFSERITVSRRQFFLDINHMESNAGYHANVYSLEFTLPILGAGQTGVLLAIFALL